VLEQISRTRGLSAGLFLKPKWLSDFLFILVNGKFEANTPTGE
jgi:hypothetical protein